jgi:hypothetical protein
VGDAITEKYNPIRIRQMALGVDGTAEKACHGNNKSRWDRIGYKTHGTYRWNETRGIAIGREWIRKDTNRLGMGYREGGIT